MARARPILGRLHALSRTTSILDKYSGNYWPGSTRIGPLIQVRLAVRVGCILIGRPAAVALSDGRCIGMWTWMDASDPISDMHRRQNELGDRPAHRIAPVLDDTLICQTFLHNMCTALQCFDAVGWAAGRASGL